MRVVLDTNIVVSALLQPLGPPAQVFLLAVSGSIQLCVSGNVYAEYEEVMRRPRLRIAETVIASTLDTIRKKGFWVSPRKPFELAWTLTTTSFSNVQPQRRPTIW